MSKTIALRGSLLAAFPLLVSCITPSPPPPAPPPSPPPELAAPIEPAPADATPHATEFGFTYCCGNAQFKMEIDCGEMLKRCYQLVDGAWQQTFGRHCKSELGDACYLTECERKC